MSAQYAFGSSPSASASELIAMFGLAALFARQQFKPVWFDRADVLKHAVRRVVVTNN